MVKLQSWIDNTLSDASLDGTEKVHITKDSASTRSTLSAIKSYVLNGLGIASITGTKAEFDAACTDGNFLYVGDVVGFSTEAAQDAVGAMVNGAFVYDDAGNSLALATRKINGVNFNATADVTVPPLRRPVGLTDAATVTPSWDTTDFGKLLTLSQATTIANPTGTPADGQTLLLRIKSSAAQTLTFGAAYRGSTDLPLPTATAGGGLTEYHLFIRNAEDGKLDYLAKNVGF